MCRARCRRRCSGRGPTTRWTCRRTSVPPSWTQSPSSRSPSSTSPATSIQSLSRCATRAKSWVSCRSPGTRCRQSCRNAARSCSGASSRCPPASRSAWRCPRRAPCGATSGWVARTSTGCSTRRSTRPMGRKSRSNPGRTRRSLWTRTVCRGRFQAGAAWRACSGSLPCFQRRTSSRASARRWRSTRPRCSGSRRSSSLSWLACSATPLTSLTSTSQRP
mmetsp:Transcript_56872/g.147832  ORF Transcript_56872/g.147832 Transcript_56872/m.147832 type:complete len:219 (-) Transcript_56872:655-1311(-)